MGLLATRPGWLGWAGNTLNLGMIRVTCPHLLGPAHNCDDLFLLSKPKGMPPAAPPHLVSLFQPFFSLSLTDTHCFALWLQCPVSALTNIKCVSLYVCLHMWHVFLCVLVNAPVCLHVCSFLASTTYQHRRVFDCQMLCAPGDGTTPQGLAQTAGRRSVLCRGRSHCLTVTGLVDGAVRDANGSPSRPGSCSSTMNLSVTRRLSPAVLPHTTAKNNPPPNVTDTSCLLLGPQIYGSPADFQ